MERIRLAGKIVLGKLPILDRMVSAFVMEPYSFQSMKCLY